MSVCFEGPLFWYTRAESLLHLKLQLHPLWQQKLPTPTSSMACGLAQLSSWVCLPAAHNITSYEFHEKISPFASFRIAHAHSKAEWCQEGCLSSVRQCAVLDSIMPHQLAHALLSDRTPADMQLLREELKDPQERHYLQCTMLPASCRVPADVS